MASRKKDSAARGEGKTPASASGVLLISEHQEAKLEVLLACNVIAHLHAKEDDPTLPTWFTKEQFYVEAIELELKLAGAAGGSYRRQSFDRRAVRTSMRLPLKLSQRVAVAAARHDYTSADFINAALWRHIDRYYQALSDRGLGEVEKRIRALLKSSHGDAERTSEKDLTRESAAADR